MSPKLPRWTAKQLIKFLKQRGFVEIGQKGSHLHLANPVSGARTTIPVHSGKTIGLGLLRAIFSQAQIPFDEIV